MEMNASILMNSRNFLWINLIQRFFKIKQNFNEINL